MYKYFHNDVPEYINDMFIPNIRKYDTRNPNMLKRPSYKTANGRKALSYIGPKLWDDIPYQLKLKNTISSFKHDFKKHYLEKMSE